jgi:hypothetical protein
MIRQSFRIGVPLALIGTAGLIAASPALAATAQGSDAGNRAASAGPATTSANGNDVSYPQCGKTFPSRPAFGIVGVNGGLANDLNPCLGPSSAYRSYKQSELYWAVSAATGSTAQPKASLYLNTADPGNLYNGKPVADWPKSGAVRHLHHHNGHDGLRHLRRRPELSGMRLAVRTRQGRNGRLLASERG